MAEKKTTPKTTKKPAAKPRRKPGPKVPPNWHSKFLDNLRRSCSVSHAAKRAGVSRKLAYEERQRNLEFSEMWDEALTEAKELLEAEAHRRAVSYSDTLMIFLLKAHDPAKYNDRMRFEVSGPNGGAIKVSTPQERAKALAELIRKASPPDDGDTAE